MSLSPAFLDELRARTVLSTLVGKTTKLTKAGREYKGCCPFHQEKTPSFYVNDDKGFYHCFGCSAHGDAIRWLTDQRGLPFMDAVKELASAAGMEVPAPDPRAAERQERAKGLHEAMEDAQRWFESMYAGLDGTQARALVERRGLKPETVRAFGLGFAPDSKTRLRTELKSYGDPLLIEAGLLISVEDKAPYDRFRGRLMIPIRDPRGRVIAFGGRVIGDGEPKYLNSPDTPLFDKGRTLYNLDKALPAARKANRVIVVEGYMDVIALAQAGIGEAVAPLGTALTEAQLERLWRIADVPILCFDGDAAGQKAAIRAAYRALPILAPGQSLEFAALPAGEDPDDIVRNGGRAKFDLCIANPTPLRWQLYLNERSKADVESPEGRAKLVHELGELGGTVNNALVKKQYTQALKDLFYNEFGWNKKERGTIGRAIIQTGARANPQVFRSFVRSALYGLFRFPQAIPHAMEMLGRVTFGDDELKRWADGIVDYGVRPNRLEYDGVKTIFETRSVAPVTTAVLKADLRFEWNVETGLALRRLVGLIDFLYREREIDERLAELNARLVADEKLDSYDEVEAERRILRAEKLMLIDMGYELGLNEPAANEN